MLDIYVKNDKKCSLVILLCASVLLTLVAGCDNTVRAPEDDGPPEFVYTITEAIPLPGDIGDVTAITYTYNKVYFATAVYSNDEATKTKSINCNIYSMNMDGLELQRIPNYSFSTNAPSDAHGEAVIHTLRVDNDGNLWVAEKNGLYFFDLPEDFDSENDNRYDYYTELLPGVVIRKLDPSGDELQCVDLGPYKSETVAIEYFFYGFEIDDKKNIYIQLRLGEFNDSFICVFDSLGNKLFELPYIKFYEDKFHRMPDGTVSLSMSVTKDGSAYQQAVKKINTERERFDDIINLDDSRMGRLAYPGSGGYDLLTSGSGKLYGYNIDENEAVTLLDWSYSSIIENNIHSMVFLTDGRILCINKCGTTENGNEVYELLFLKVIPYSEFEAKTVLTLATLTQFHSTFLDAVIDFNRRNPDYFLQVVDYSGYNINDAISLLNTEIITGNVPDIINVAYLPYEDYVNAGVLTDLYQFIDADPDISRDDFIQGVFTPAEINGGLYQVYPMFSLQTLIGHPNVVESDTGWNIDEFREVLGRNPDADVPLGTALSRSAFLRNSITFDLDTYIDTDTGTVSFDTPEFISLLVYSRSLLDEAELLHTFGDSYYDVRALHNSEVFYTQRQILAPVRIEDFRSYRYYKTIFGGDIILKGYPAETGHGNAFDISYGLAISDVSEHKDTAWSFVRTFLDENWQANIQWGFPTNRAAFDKNAVNAMDEGSVNFMGVESDALVQSDVDSIIAAAGSVSSIYGWKLFGLTESVWNIVSEEVSGFYAGTCSAQDAARVIQSRVSVMVSERS